MTVRPKRKWHDAKEAIMRDDEKLKETGAESTEETVEEPKQLDRSTFLKTLGVGIGAVGLDLLTGGHLAARTAAELDDSRGGIQKLVRGLLEDPSKAKDFLDSPRAVAEEFGVRLTEDDAHKIQEAFKKLAAEAAAADAPVMGGHQDWAHKDGGWNDWYDKKVERGIKRTPKKPPVTKPPLAPKQRKQ